MTETIETNAPTKLSVLIDRSDLTITSISVSPARTRSDGNYGNDKYSILIAANVSEDANVVECFCALYEAALSELDRQEAYTKLVMDTHKWLHAWRTPDELRAKRDEVATSALFHSENRAHLLMLAEREIEAAERRGRDRQERQEREVRMQTMHAQDYDEDDGYNEGVEVDEYEDRDIPL